MIYAFKCDCGSTREIEQSIHAEIVEPCGWYYLGRHLDLQQFHID
jgi:hypothetical protein